LQKEQIIFLIVLFVAIVVGNMAIIVSIVTSKTGRQSRMKYFIVHLAIAGLYFNIFMFDSNAARESSFEKAKVNVTS